jgi:Flp pilus assembly protein TadD
MADAAALVERARALLRSGDLAGADSAASQALALEPDHPQLLNLLGLVRLAQRRFEEAESLFGRAVARDRRAPEFHHNRGIALKGLGRGADAVASFRRARELAPNHPEILFSLGTALFGEDRDDEATAVLRRAAGLAPDRADIKVKLGDTLLKRGRFEDARAEYESALAARPGSLDAVIALAFARYRLGDHAGAEGLYRQALAAGRNDLTVLTTLGVLANLRGDLETAEQRFREAIAVDPALPRPHLNLATLLLVTGRLEEGWKEYRVQIGTTPAADLARLPSGATIALRGEQGLGDELFFLRWLPGLRRRGFAASLHLHPRLAPLLERSPDVLAGELAAPGSAAAAADLRIGDLPLLLWGDERYPGSIRLVPAPGRLAAMRSRLAELGPAPYVGVAWRAGTPIDEQGAVMKALSKALPLNVLARMLAGVTATVVSVQRAPRGGETEELARLVGRPVHDLSAANADLEEALALMALLDEYVGVSSTSVHLRHALGRASRVLVPAPPEWRWGVAGESPWFPGTAVYREVPGQGWDDAVARLREDLGQGDAR